MIGKEIKEKICLGITLPNNAIKYIMKVIKSLERGEILLNGSTTKITGQDGGFLSFYRPLTTAGLPLICTYTIS